MKTTTIPKSTANTRMKKGVKDQKFALVKRLTSIKAKAKILKYRFTIFSTPSSCSPYSCFPCYNLKAKSTSILTDSRTLFNEGGAVSIT